MVVVSEAELLIPAGVYATPPLLRRERRTQERANAESRRRLQVPVKSAARLLDA